MMRMLLALLIGAVSGEAVLAQSRALAAISCILTPSRRAEVASAVEGVLVEVLVERGDAVARGQPLARLDTVVEERVLEAARFRAESDAAILSRQAQLREALQRLQQVETLRRRGVASVQALNEVTAEVEVARNLLREAEVEREMARMEALRVEAILEQRTLRAPADGVVLQRHRDAGEYASEQAPVLTLVTVDPLWAEILLPAAALGRVRLGEIVTLRIEPPVAREVVGAVVVIDPVVDAASRTFGVRVSLENPGGAIAAGLRCEPQFAGLRERS